MWKRSLAVLPGVSVSLLPKLACPMCWPAYAGLLSSLGLGFLISTTYLLPVTVAFLVIAVLALGFRAGTRRGYGPMLVGVVAATAVFFGKFLLESNAAMYGGVALLLAASMWNSWPLRADRLIQLRAKEKSR